MAIQILPARLANQIAAGEVVERPASVVKELVENSLDSGASRIDVDIEKGGAKLIRVRDNGQGIAKEELGLALSRHATSKIQSLDDLEAIMSLGFRGEALASISSVSRLTLTSRPATQAEAWAAHSEGRDMAVNLMPAAHPIGTTVEVLDLFFNTPARRKFLRTEKTEFNHIDELLKRIALSRFDVSITLRHNGKVVRQYRAAQSDIQIEKRISAVCGAAFVRHMLKIELEHQGLKLFGWITTPEGARQQSDLQFCYVNGRMMRDKLINHAIRQSYENSLKPEQFAAYILFIELDAHQVDVNVHPAKHEVRFHQARLVHDFIYQALSDALVQSQHIEAPTINAAAYHSSDSLPVAMPEPVSCADSMSTDALANTTEHSVPEHLYRAVDAVPAYPGRADYAHRTDTADVSTLSHSSEVSFSDSSYEWHGRSSKSSHPRSRQHEQSQHYAQSRQNESGAPSQQQQRIYQQLLSTPDELIGHIREDHSMREVAAKEGAINTLGKAVTVVEQRYLVMADKTQCVLVSLDRAEWWRIRGQLEVSTQALKSQPLLVPLSLKFSTEERQHLEQAHELYRRFGIEFKARNKETVMIMGVASPLRQQNLQQLIPDLVSYTAQLTEQETDAAVCFARVAQWLAYRIATVKDEYTLSGAIQLIAELEQLWQGCLPLEDAQFVRAIDFSATITALSAN